MWLKSLQNGVSRSNLATSEQQIHLDVALFTLYQQNIGQLWNANELPHLPAKACSRLTLPKRTPSLFRWFHYHWQTTFTEILRFSLGFPLEHNHCFSFVLLFLKFQFSSRYPLLFSHVYHEIGIYFSQGNPSHVLHLLPVISYDNVHSNTNKFQAVWPCVPHMV